MVSSIDFFHPIKSALTELATVCESVGITVTQTEEVNKGAGAKIRGTVANESVAMVLYYNRGKGTSTKIVFEKLPGEARTRLLAAMGAPAVVAKTKPIPIYATFHISDGNLRQSIKENLLITYPDSKELGTQSHMEYRFKIASGGNEITITQFSSGKLLLQGSYSDLVDRIVDIIDKIKPLSNRERTLLYVPEDSKQAVQDKIDEAGSAFEEAQATAESRSDDYLAFLFENDRQSFATGEGLTKILEDASQTLPEYNFLVAIYSKVLEGFVIKLMVKKAFFTIEDYRSNPEIADIGNALRKGKFTKYIRDTRRYGYVIEDLISVWEGCRCKEMHSDPVNVGIISVNTLEDAKNRIGRIKTCMSDAFHILVIHGLNDADLAQAAVPTRKEASVESPLQMKLNGYIGTDESGKGDYFGPLVIAGVYLDSESEKKLIDAGVKDSKKLSDDRVLELASTIRSRLDKTRYSVVSIGPEKYNELYERMGNLNKLLAWGHARSIENILASVNCKSVISDQFGDESYIKKALLEKGKGVELLQMPRAEEHTAVAAASILAREAFLLRLSALGKESGIELPKGASAEVEDTARRFVQKQGMGALTKYAKLHFKTTKKIEMAG
jgi:ribonuclease HIII